MGDKAKPGDALGLIETRGLIGMIEAADAMVKTANVVFVGWQKVDAGLVTAIVGGRGNRTACWLHTQLVARELDRAAAYQYRMVMKQNGYRDA